MNKTNLLRILTGTALALSIPFIVMQFSEEWDWDLGDFIIIGTLLIGSGTIFVLTATKVNPKYRPLIAIGFILMVMLIWAELAVGIIGTPLAGS
jgi:hypothetical protein